MDVLRNDLQHLMARFLRTTLRLPDTTSSVILMLESGQKPAFTYCMRRTTSFVHQCSISSDEYLHALVGDLQFMEVWNSHVVSLTNRNAIANDLPRMRMPTHRSAANCVHTMAPSTILSCLKSTYDHALHAYTMDTPHSVSAQHRTTSTYVQDIWNRRVANSQHARHPMYAQMDIPYSHYRAWLRMRTLTLGLPAYEYQATSSACQLACDSRGDLKHWLMHCQHARCEFAARNLDTPLPSGTTWAFFNERKDLITLAQQVHGFCALLRLVPAL